MSILAVIRCYVWYVSGPTHYKCAHQGTDLAKWGVRVFAFFGISGFLISPLCCCAFAFIAVFYDQLIQPLHESAQSQDRTRQAGSNDHFWKQLRVDGRANTPKKPRAVRAISLTQQNWPMLRSGYKEGTHGFPRCRLQARAALCAAFITVFFIRFSPAQYKLIS